MKPNPWDWDEQDLRELIALQVPESLELEYKQCGAIQNADSKKNEISKDVSAFANSAGGTIVYGMKENGHVPAEIDIGYDPEEISKEWLEQVINSRIHRRIDGIRINQVKLSYGAQGRVAYVVFIPSSMRAPHQAADKRFYKRFNFESVPMEEYEIRDVARRLSSPDLQIKFAFHPDQESTTLNAGHDGNYSSVKLTALLRNDSATPAEYAVIHIYIDKRIKIVSKSGDVNESSETVELGVIDGVTCALKKYTVLWDKTRPIPIFTGTTAEMPSSPIGIAIPVGPDWFVINYVIASPGMAIRNQSYLIVVKDDKAILKPAVENLLTVERQSEI